MPGKRPAPPEPSAPPRASTGVPGFDDILGGGFPARRLYLIQGDPGAGKTTLALQFLLQGVKEGERSLYVTLSETMSELEDIARSHQWSLEGLSVHEVASGAAHEETETTLYEPGEIELGERIGEILAEVDRLAPARLVIDSCSELRLLAQTALRYRRQILALKERLAALGCTILLIDNPAPASPDMLLQSVAHGVVTMEQLSPVFGAERRRLRVQKIRGLRYRGGYHDFIIRTGGLAVFPRLVAAEHHGEYKAEAVSSGIVELDALLGGGPTAGTSFLLLGPAGCGKSAVATRYAFAAAERGQRAALFVFDESAPIYRARAESLGMNLRPHLEARRLTLQQVDPAEMSPGEFAYTVRGAVEAEARVVVIDSLNGYLNAMAEESLVALQLHELLAYLGHRGVLTILTVAEHGLVGRSTASPIDVSYLADSVLLFRYFEAQSQLRKALSVVKKRVGGHEATIRELVVGEGGIRVGPILDGIHGVLGGTPMYVGDGGAAPTLSEGNR